MPETTMREPLDVVVRGKRSEVKALIAAWDERDAVADFPTAEPLIERLHTAVDPDARHEHEGGSDAHVMRGDARPPAGEGRMPREWSDEQIAERFHEAYERLAPSFGYETREASAKPWADVPEQNRALMTAVAAEVRAELLSSSPDEGERTAREALGEEAIEEIGAALVREGVAFDSHAPLEVVRMVLAHVPAPAPSSPSGESEREAAGLLRSLLDDAEQSAGDLRRALTTLRADGDLEAEIGSLGLVANDPELALDPAHRVNLRRAEIRLGRLQRLAGEQGTEAGVLAIRFERVEPAAVENGSDPFILAQEKLLLELTEAVCALIEREGVDREQLAERVGLAPASVEEMFETGAWSFHALANVLLTLGYRASINAFDPPPPASPSGEQEAREWRAGYFDDEAGVPWWSLPTTKAVAEEQAYQFAHGLRALLQSREAAGDWRDETPPEVLSESAPAAPVETGDGDEEAGDVCMRCGSEAEDADYGGCEHCRSESAPAEEGR